MMRRDPACPCAGCNPPAPHWSERWSVIVPAIALAVLVVLLTWNGSLFG